MMSGGDGELDGVRFDVFFFEGMRMYLLSWDNLRVRTPGEDEAA